MDWGTATTQSHPLAATKHQSSEVIPVNNSLAFQAAGWGIEDREYLGEREYLYEKTLSAAAARLATFFNARSTLETGPVQVILHGNSCRSKWWIEVRARRVRGYLVIQQHAIICLHPDQEHRASNMYASFERAVQWLLVLPQRRALSWYDGLRTFRRLELVVHVTGAECSLSWSVYTH